MNILVDYGPALPSCWSAWVCYFALTQVLAMPTPDATQAAMSNQGLNLGGRSRDPAGRTVPGRFPFPGPGPGPSLNRRAQLLFPPLGRFKFRFELDA